MASVKGLILRFMEDRLGIETIGVDEDTPLFSSGIIDSTGMADLIAFLEAETQVQFGPEDITLDNLDSIGRLLKFVGNGHVG